MAGEMDYCLGYRLSYLHSDIQATMREKAGNVLMHAGEEYLAVTFMRCDLASLDLMRSSIREEMKQYGALIFHLERIKSAAQKDIYDLQFKNRFQIAEVFTLEEFETMCLPSEELLAS